MRIARFLDGLGIERLGQPVDSGAARLIEGDLFGVFTLTDELVDVDRLMPPVSPPNIFGIGLNYRAHAAEGGRAVPDKPLIFMKATSSVIASGEPIRLPPSAPNEVDFEAELAVVIGKSATRVSAASAGEYVLGYTCVNDVTARDCQKRLDGQWTRAKGFDSFCPMGPWLVTPDEIDPANLEVRSILNEEPMQQGSTRDLVFDCSALISYLSDQFTLLPGTVICTGTPAGVGFSRQPPVFLRPGDTVTVQIEGIGELSNPVIGD